ncbi:hypothetical protein QW060_18065 [Myroides ceti]|uniref:Uncharacterized protein n=1 Tax=Paenimyroides ceti TaxID=395087 RepID=A0ABT8CZA0_9FLAO|nr:hypothetical protein [Paenimyroides ceti]MDN3708983.1 hypothetical protein [Paenimyroides ceti]
MARLLPVILQELSPYSCFGISRTFTRCTRYAYFFHTIAGGIIS